MFFVFGPLWFVIGFMVVYYLIQAASRPKQYNPPPTQPMVPKNPSKPIVRQLPPPPPIQPKFRITMGCDVGKKRR